MPILPLAAECCRLAPSTSGIQFAPNSFRFLNSATAVPTARSGLQRRVITEPCKDAEAQLTNFFLTVTVKACILDPPSVGE